MGWIIPLIIILVIAIIVLVAVLTIKKEIGNVSRSVFGTNTLKEGLDKQADMLSETPKSISSMTKIFLPNISRNFPEFNWFEFRQRSENMLILAFRAMTEHSINELPDISAQIKGQVEGVIANDVQRGEHTYYNNVKIHGTEIANYISQNGTCIIALQSAVEYVYFVKRGDTIIEGTDVRPVQTKYNIELTYVQDEKLANEHSGDGAFSGIKCPSCGAPVTDLGHKVCDYCGVGVIEANMHAWVLSRFYEVPTNLV